MAKLHRNGPTAEQASFDVADAALVMLDAHGRIENWPPGAEQLLGHTADDVLGQPVASLLAPEDAAGVPDLAAHCHEHGYWSGLVTARRESGSLAGLAVQVVPVQDAGRQTHWVILTVSAPAVRGWEMSRTLLERLVAQVPVGMAIVDPNLRFVWSNTALEHFGGGPAHQRVGRRVGALQPGLDADAIEVQMRHVLETGEPVLGYEHVGRFQPDPAHEQAHSMSFVRLDAANGQPVGVCYTVIDITERYRSRQRLALLDRASQYIGRTLDVRQTAQDLADVAVPDLADLVAVDLLDSVLSGGDPLTGPLEGEEVRLRRSGQQSWQGNDPEAVITIGDLTQYHAWSPPSRCLSDGVSWRAERLTPGSRLWAADGDGVRMARYRQLGLHTAMVVPIRARGTTLGVATFFRGPREEPFSEDDLHLAEDFVARAAVCMDNARRYTREREAALVLQRSLLPQAVPDQNAVHVASSYRPADELADVGGDWFDVIPLSGARVALVVGDVTGHGIDAVATMGRLRTAVQTLAALELRPEELLAHLDDLVGRVTAETDDSSGRPPGAGTGAWGASCLYAVYDPISRSCTMAGAGHLSPAVLTPDGMAEFIALPPGPRLGVGGPPFESVQLTVEEGSVLAFYTDGLLASHDAGPDRDGRQEELRRALETPGPTLDALCAKVIDTLVPARPYDDVTLLLAATRSLAPDRYATWDLPADPAVVSRAREQTMEQLTSWGLEELGFTTELVVSELVTNAIRYGAAPIRLRLILEHTLTCEVSDSSNTSPYLRHPRATDEGGRGLFLISQVTQRWGTRDTPDGKIIWTEQPLSPEDLTGPEPAP